MSYQVVSSKIVCAAWIEAPSQFKSLLIIWTLVLTAFAQTAKCVADETNSQLSPGTLRQAIEKAIPRLQAGAIGSAKERECFTCHSQALPVFALQAAHQRGLDIDQQVLQEQLKHTWKHLERGKSAYAQAKGQGGQAMTAGYALWTLEAGEWPADDVTEAVVHYLIDRHRDQKHWVGGGRRPPSSGSSFTATYVSLRGLSAFGNQDQQAQIVQRREQAANWVLNTTPVDTEDHVFRLRTLPYIHADQPTIDQAVKEILQLQSDNGGWAQNRDVQPDAYATGSVLTALHEVGGLTAQHPAMVRGYSFLLTEQLPDGTWHVVTRAKPIQEYFESDFPHGSDQFISVAATGWAVLALVQALPEKVSEMPVETLPATTPNSPPQVTVKRCEDFEVTGRGDALPWERTQWVDLHRRPMAAHDYKARFKILYSEKGLYVLFDGTDRRLSATLQEDFLDLWTEDVYECFFWPSESQPLYFEYEISPLGYELPILIPNVDGKFLGWRPWHYEGSRKTRKQIFAGDVANTPLAKVANWRAEVFIPFELLKPLHNVPPRSGTKWRANFYRVDYDPLESDTPLTDRKEPSEKPVTQWDWSRVGPSFHEYQKFGTLVFE